MNPLVSMSLSCIVSRDDELLVENRLNFPTTRIFSAPVGGYLHRISTKIFDPKKESIGYQAALTKGVVPC